MSLTSISESTNDAALLDRINASIAKETFDNPQFGDTNTGAAVKLSGPSAVLNQFIWPCCIDFEAAYSYAVDGGNPNPGGDPAVITDADIQSAVQVHWPVDPVPPEPEPEPEPEPPPTDGVTLTATPSPDNDHTIDFAVAGLNGAEVGIDYGDGTTATITDAATHVYQTEGDFTASLDGHAAATATFTIPTPAATQQGETT